ncbi:MAG: hypothetical protein V1690_02985 [Candidatus Moraniibacteriota bacterium]
MKKTLLVLLVMVGLCVSCTSQLRAEEPVNSVTVAQAMGGIDLTVLQGQYSFDRGAGHGGWTNFNIEATLKGDLLYITYLATGDGIVVINRGDAPVPGLPANAVGETRNFSLWLSTPNGSAYGSFSKDLLLPGESFKIELGPGFIARTVLFSGKGTTKPENTILRTDTGNVSGYDQQVGAFVVWIDPLRASTPYEIIDITTGLPITVSTISPVSQLISADTNSVVSIGFKGGVMPIVDSRGYLDNQKFDGSLADGTPAKVYIWTINGVRGNINAWSGSQTGALHIRVLRWIPLEQGEMPEIANSDADQQDGHAYAYAGSGYDKIVVIITGNASAFDIDFSAN